MSLGTDEIFALDYVPTSSQMRRVEEDTIMVHNDDGLLDVPAALMPNKKGRYLNLVMLSKEDKLKAKLMMAEQRMKRQITQQEELKTEIKRIQCKSKGMTDDEIKNKEMHEAIRSQYEK